MRHRTPISGMSESAQIRASRCNLEDLAHWWALTALHHRIQFCFVAALPNCGRGALPADLSEPMQLRVLLPIQGWISLNRAKGSYLRTARVRSVTRSHTQERSHSGASNSARALAGMKRL
eukprot:IDg4906t1